MPVETATFISQLNSADPAHTDGLNQSDAHARLIKSVLQNQFPNLGTVAVTATAAGLNAASGAYGTAGVLEVVNNGTVAGGEVKLDGIGATGTLAQAGSVDFLNAGTAGGGGLLDIQITNAAGTLVTVATLDSSGNLTITGTLNAAAIQKLGHELLPTGVILKWSGTVASIPSGYQLCDGTNGSPDLRDKFVVGAGNSYSPASTGGATSVTATSTSAGTHQHGGATGSAGAASPTATADSQGAHSHGGSTGSYALTINDIPSHSHTLQAVADGGTGRDAGGRAGPPGNLDTTSSVGGGAGHSHPVSSDGSHSHNVTVSPIAAHMHSISTDGSHNHNVTVATLPPYFSLCFIYKL